MRILQISTGVQRIPPDKLGSPEGHITLLSKELVKMGHEVTILDRMESVSDAPYEQLDCVKIIRLPVKYLRPNKMENKLSFMRWLRGGLNTIFFILKVSRWLKHNKQFDVINTYVISQAFILILLHNNLRTKLIYNHHASFWPSQHAGIIKKFLLSSLGHFTINRVKLIIVLNETVRKHFISQFSIKDSQIVVLPTGLDFNMLRLDMTLDQEKLVYQLEEKRVVLFVGRINPDKGFPLCIGSAPGPTSPASTGFAYKSSTQTGKSLPFYADQLVSGSDTPGTYSITINFTGSAK